jgi:cation:H+ antiporter
MAQFGQLSLYWNLALFLGAAALVWLAGTRLSQYADRISSRTGIGQAVTGLLLLAGVTSLPEIGVTITSSAAGDTKLALNNLLGSIAMQVAILVKTRGTWTPCRVGFIALISLRN